MGSRDWRVATLTDDRDREQVDGLLRRLIDHPGGAQMLSRSWEQDQGFDSLVLGVYGPGDRLVGGMWAGDPYTEFMLDPISSGFPATFKAAYIRAFLTLHHVAVDPEFRNRGIGRSLLRRLTHYARTRHKQVIYGVTRPTSAGFYRANKYQVARPTEALYLHFEKQSVMWPISGEPTWFARSVRHSPSHGFSRSRDRTRRPGHDQPADVGHGGEAARPTRGETVATAASPWRGLFATDDATTARGPAKHQAQVGDACKPGPATPWCRP
jgi:GNAT superfamily N-acetyltransferase